ncbi:DUF262 domain-containing protein [Flavobacteriaceae bacterium 144Ye]|nr:DUF262 domain-containing protein [Flavobacteriaceae bacterium 144Ye]
MAIKKEKEIQKKMSTGIFNLVQDRHDFLLPHVIDLIKNKGWLNIQPEYQRRRVWNVKRKSKLIESILMNIPIPPIFLLETNYRDYEVMDGQQRLDALVSFFNDEFELTDLTHWSELNGYSYGKLPSIVQRGLERRRISAITVMVENFIDDKEKVDLRSLVFERLNTGGMQLNSQEIRNCVYYGSFNNLLIELSSLDLFTDVWGIPNHEGTDKISDELKENALFKRMGDCEIVLRFFAISESSHLKDSLSKMMDECMKRNMDISNNELDKLKQKFIDALSLSKEVFGEDTFKLTNPESNRTYTLKNLYDAIMVVFYELKGKKEIILKNKKKIQKRIETFFSKQENFESLSRRKGNAKEIKEMKKIIKDIILDVISS